MPTNFWHKLPQPFFVMAPMANVTDCVFRKLFAKYGKPDVIWTEFVSADGLVSSGRERLLIDLKFSPKERPIVAQLFTGHPEAMRRATALCARLRFDGLDINMGCPDRAVERQGGGAGMIKDPKAASAIIEAARTGFKGPVSVKTRIGYNKIDLEWIQLLLKQNLSALTVHLRTRKEMSEVPAHWELMPKIIEMRDEIQAGVALNRRTLIIGNGDIMSLEDAACKCKKYGCDGAMIGRGIFGSPWMFEKVAALRKRASNKKESLSFVSLNAELKSPEVRLMIMVEHAKLFEKEFGSKKRKRWLKNFAVMRKHFKAYVSGWDGAKELRALLMEAEDSTEVDRIVRKFRKQ